MTADEIWDPTGLYFGLGEIGGYDLSSMKVVCPGTEPADTGFCPAGGRTILRGAKFCGARTTNTTPPPLDTPDYLTGATSSVYNESLDADGAGRNFGTWHVDLDAGGSWDGTYEGARFVGGEGCPPASSGIPCWTQELKLTGCGAGGIADGKHFHAAMHFVEFQLAFCCAGSACAPSHRWRRTEPCWSVGLSGQLGTAPITLALAQ